MVEGHNDKPARAKSRQSLAHVPSRSTTTTDITALKRADDAKSMAKRIRGKSLGPGGLDTLTETNANVLKMPPAILPKSILKPTIPLTPPRTIPSFDELRRKNGSKPESPAKNTSEDLLIDFFTPAPSRASGSEPLIAGAESLADPFSPIARASPDHTSGSDPQAMDDGDEERRKAQKKAIMDQRAARRKSLANRRVSFAPEATLHTWSVMELMEDSTISSASNSTRRQSTMTAAQSPMPQVSAQAGENDCPIVPVEQQQDHIIDAASQPQRELHQRKRRRTSDIAHISDDDTFSSPGDGADSSPLRVEESIDSESDTDGDTAMSLDEATQQSIRSSDSSDTQTSLDDRLRQAASLAGTKGIRYDEDGTDEEDDQPMEIADGTITHAFRRYARSNTAGADSQLGDADKENLNHFQNGFPNATEEDQEEIDDNHDGTIGVTMEMTRAMGGIISRGSQNHAPLTIGPGRSNASRPSSLGVNGTSYGDETMDLTVAKGGILSYDGRVEDDDEQISDEDMTMEMTNVVGGLESTAHGGSNKSNITEETESMDMTMAAGGILPPIEEQTEPQSFVDEGMTMAMDMTRAMGGILQRPLTVIGYPDVSTLAQTPIDEAPTPGAQLNHELASSTTVAVTSSISREMALVATESGSPTLRPRLSARRSAPRSQSSTPKSVPKVLASEDSLQTTPLKQLTPAPAKSTSPTRTPVLTAHVTARSASPKKLFAKELKQRASPASRKSPQRQQDLLFLQDATTGLHTPKVVLHASKPHQHFLRRGNGVGIDRNGTGSPRVSEMLSRRSSIGDTVPDFQLRQAQKRQIQFENPQRIEQEIDTERAEDHRRESGRFIMEQEASDQQDENTTQNLKEMIESMSPKKERKPVRAKSRKSLAVGSARGLLGKRPTELDEDDEVDSTPKRLKTVSREGSPVKKVHLPKPPTKEETTGRLSKVEQMRLTATAQPSNTPTLAHSPMQQAKTPDRIGRFREAHSTQKPVSFESKMDNVVIATDISTTHPETLQDTEEDKISLQAFLNMTNVHFIELSTTKRRHTIAQPVDDISTDDMSSTSQAPFVAASTTLPLLELYQHATRELKSYISSGRKIVRQIEAETLTDQPAIFREYVDARPDVKAIMDNQFRNGKTNARLQSKESWYTWRGQLVDGLQNGLEGIKDDLEKDQQVLSRQQGEMDRVLPVLTVKKEQLDRQLHDLKKRLAEFESVDREALRLKRQELVRMNDESSQLVERALVLEQQMQEKVEMLSQSAELREEMDDQIEAAMRVQEEQNRWHSKDVSSRKSVVQKLEHESGWRLLTAEHDAEAGDDFGTALTLRYAGQLRLFMYPAALQVERHAGRRRSGRKSRSVSGPNAPISLTYSPDDNDEDRPKELPTELRFFLQLLQGQLHSFMMMPKGSVTCPTVLKTVSDGWTCAQKVASEIRMLKTCGLTRVSIVSDEKLSAKLLLMQPDRSRIDVEFVASVLPLNDGEVSIITVVTASPLYGPVTSLMDGSKTKKVQAALSKEVESKPFGEGSWVSAVRGFEEWIQAQTQAQTQIRAAPLKANSASRTPPAKGQDDHTTQARAESRRATTQSPQGSTTPKVLARSPLAPKTTNSRLQKKTLPVPKKVMQGSQSQQESLIRVASQQKENMIPAAVRVNGRDVGVVNDKLAFDDVFAGARPAIAPEQQEAMMHTPVKRRAGALRRSPM